MWIAECKNDKWNYAAMWLEETIIIIAVAGGLKKKKKIYQEKY